MRTGRDHAFLVDRHVLTDVRLHECRQHSPKGSVLAIIFRTRCTTAKRGRQYHCFDSTHFRPPNACVHDTESLEPILHYFVALGSAARLLSPASSPTHGFTNR